MEILQRVPIAFKKVNPFWLATMVFIVLSAFLVADLTNRIIEWKLMVPGYSSIKDRAEKIHLTSQKPRKSLLDLVSQVSESNKTPINSNTTFLSKYSLIGTAVGKGGASYAVFEDLSRKGQIFLREGETTGDGVMVKKVALGKVLLIADGMEFLMEIVYKEKKGKVVALAPSTESSNLKKVINKREVGESLKDMNKIMTQARIIPYIVKNKNQGYRIFSIRPGSIYTKIGLKNGDIIQRVNNIELESPGKAYSLFQQLKDEPKISLDILRRGEKKTLSIEIR